LEREEMLLPPNLTQRTGKQLGARHRLKGSNQYIVVSPVASDTNTQKLQITQNNALRILTGCTMYTNIDHLHKETKTLPISCHLKLHASQLQHHAQHPSHPLYDLTHKTEFHRKKKQTIFLIWKKKTINVRNDNMIPLIPDILSQNLRTIHTIIIVAESYKPNPILSCCAPEIDKSEQTLPRCTLFKAYLCTASVRKIANVTKNIYTE